MTRNGTKTSAGARTQIQNPEARVHYRAGTGWSYDKFCVSWTADGARYHVWLGPDGKPEENKVYKNPPDGVTSGSGYFRTRVLSSTSARLAAMIEEAMERVDLDEARACFDAKEQREKEQRAAAEAEEKKDKALRDAAPEMYEAIKRFLSADESYSLSDAPSGNKFDELGFSKQMLHEAITKAERTAA